MNLRAAVGRAYLAVPKEAKGPVRVTRVSAGALDPITDTVADSGELTLDTVGFAVPVVPDTRTNAEVRRTVAVVVNATGLPWAPATGDRVTWNAEEWTVQAVTGIPNRAAPVAYRLEVRQ